MKMRFAASFLLVGLVGLVGCDSGPKIVKISGTVTSGGKPVPHLRLNFQPEKGRPSWGDTDANGKFTLEYDEKNKGAVVGNHTVSCRPQDPGGVMDWRPSALALKAAEKYGEGSKNALKIEIKEATENLEIKFD